MCMSGRMFRTGVKSGGLMGALYQRSKNRGNNAKPLGRNENTNLLGRNRALGGGELNQIGGSGTLLGGFMQGGQRGGMGSGASAGAGGRSGGNDGGNYSRSPRIFYDEK